MKILTNHIGFDSRKKKYAIAACGESEVPGDSAVFSLIRDGVTVFEAAAGERHSVDGWKGRYYYFFDFTEIGETGEYTVRFEDGALSIRSSSFRIAEQLLTENTVSDILFYFKSQRCTWRWNEADRSAPFFGGRGGRVDVSGGWFDASGDYSKYLSHLSYANYLNPQQTPLVVWALLMLKDSIASNKKYGGSLLEDRALEEGIYGADFLVRMQDPEGYFYTTVFDQWNKDPGNRKITAFRGKEGVLLENYEAGYRKGGGIAVAALARASRFGKAGEFEPGQYLEAAVRGWEHLESSNLKYLDNGRENIIDSYCALLAAVELYESTDEERFLDAARVRAGELKKLYSGSGYWTVEEGNPRPYFHAAEAGFPIVALAEYCGIEPEESLRSSALALAEQSVRDIISISADRKRNVFMLARQWVKPAEGVIRQAFFMPHENESGYWWQGENARLASLSYAALRVKNLPGGGGEELLPHLDDFAEAQLNWILGCNPFDMCMLQGHGRNNPRYEEFYPNAPGGICNGITAGFEDEDDIDFLPASVEGCGDHRWRWSEQWIPHAAWFLLAVSAGMQGGEQR